MPFHGLAGRFQKATLWPRVGTDSSSQPIVSATPETLNVRWDDTQRIMPGPDGVPLTVDATAVVDRAIPLGSSMCKGAAKDLPTDGQQPQLDLMEVVLMQETPDYTGRNFYREVGLMRARNVLGRTA